MRARWSAIFVALALIAAACGGGDADEAADDLITEAGAARGAVDDIRDSVADASAPIEIPNQTDPEATGFNEITLDVQVLDDPSLEELIALTPEFFTAQTGININYRIVEQQEIRELAAICVGVCPPPHVSIMGSVEAAQFGANGWLENLAPLASADTEYDIDDIIPSVRAANSDDDGLYAVPFYAESSLIMFNQQIMDEVGINFPEEPTWEEIAEIARSVHTDEVAGICLRGLPGWDQLGETLTTVVNTFGGTWWEANPDGTPAEARINQRQPNSGFRAATEFYVDLARDAGPDDSANFSFPQCLEQFQNGEVAIWYDSTVAGPILEADDSPIAGNVGYAFAPTDIPGISGGWLQSWGLAIPASQDVYVDEAWEFISWATSAETVRLIGENAADGWASELPATRLSTFEIPEYIAAHEPYCLLYTSPSPRDS